MYVAAAFVDSADPDEVVKPLMVTRVPLPASRIA